MPPSPTLKTPFLDVAPTPRAFTNEQWETLLTFADTLIPALDAAETDAVRASVANTVADPQWHHIDPFLSQSCRDCPEFREYLNAVLLATPARTQRRLAGLMDLLRRGGLATFVLTGSMAPFTELARAAREGVLRSWAVARLAVFRGLFATLKELVVAAYLRRSEVALRALAYPRVDPEKPRRPGFHRFEFVEVAEEEEEGVGGGGVGVEIEADVVVVGSGAGGGVAAARLAKEFEGLGLRVYILEKGEWVPTPQLPLNESTYGKVYAGAGAVKSVDGKTLVLAGSTWGGGTTVNYSASLQLPAAVREEWARDYGLEFAETAEFQECLDKVCERMGVSTEHITHNMPNSLLLEGARRIGMEAKVVPQNTGGHAHSCGYCNFGCSSGQKQGGTATWLVDAVKAGAKAIQRCHVQKIHFSATNAVTGLTALVGSSTRLHISTPRIVVAGGALFTPCLLLNSGLNSPHLGRNLKLHPCIYVWAFFPPETQTFPYRGPLLTSLLTHASNRDGNNYGARGLCIPHHPGFSGAQLPWTSAAAWRSQILRYNNSVLSCAIVRDRDSVGTVTHDPATLEPVVKYSFAPFDRASAIEGAIALAKAYVAAGAVEVWTDVDGAPAHVVGGGGGETLAVWCAALRRRGVPAGRSASAHQMGTCRMAAKRSAGVCDPRGRVWGTRGLWVADASLLPTATGVNPMVTTMAVAEWVAGGVVRDVRGGREKEV